MKDTTSSSGQPPLRLPGVRKGYFTVIICALFALLGMIPQAAQAQLYAGSLSGIVTDPAGAVVVDANVTLTDLGKGIEHRAKSDETGRYLFRALAPATYKLSVEAMGFASVVVPSVTVNVNENATSNVVLKVGQSSETITVQADSTEGVQSEDASNGQVVDRDLIKDLPLIGRDVMDLSFLAPGVSSPSGGTFTPGSSGGNNFISQGSRNGQADIVIDGVSTTNYDQNTGWVDPLYTPSVDAVQEFKVQQSNFGAEFGFSGATVINVVTRSGTNTIHGSAYEYLRNTVLNSEDFFGKQGGVPNPAYHWNDFGGAFGGPIKKDKIFFFFDFEGERQVTPQINVMDLPTDRERAGDFGQLCPNAGGTFNAQGECVTTNSAGIQVVGGPGQIWDPFTYQAGVQHLSTSFVPNNDLSQYTSHGNFWSAAGGLTTSLPGGSGVGNLINPVSKNLFQFLPHATNQNLLKGNTTMAGGNVTNSNQYDAKVDYQITSNDNFSGRWSTNWGNLLAANLFKNDFDSNTQGPVSFITYEGSANYTHTFSSKTLLTVTAGATHAWTYTQGDPVPESTWTSVGLPSSLEFNPNGNVHQAPLITINGYNIEKGSTFGGQGWDVMMYGQDVGGITANLSHVMRNHEIKAGGEVHLHRINFTQWGLPNGSYTYNGAGTAENWAASTSTGGDAWADYMTGWANGWSAVTVPPSPATQNYQYAGFVQDNWKFNHKLTFNVGFRYDLDMPRTERHDRMSTFDPNAPSPIASQVSGVDPTVCPACNNLKGAFEYVGGANSRYPFNVYRGAIGPRFGFAYSVRPSTVIRGGIGLYYDPGKSGAAGVGSGGAGFQNYATQATWTNLGNNSNNIPNYQTILGQPVAAVAPVGKLYGVDTQLGQDFAGIPVKTFNTLPRETTWSLGFQHEFASKTLVDVNYIGKHAEHLYLGGFTNYLDHISASAAANYRSLASTPAGYQQQNSTTAVPNQLSYAIASATQAAGYGEWSNPLGPTTQSEGGNNSAWFPWNGFLPFPQYADGPWGTGGIQNVDPPIAKSNYHGLTVAVSRPMIRGLQFLGNYAAQSSYDNGSSQGNNDYMNPVNTYGVQDPNDLAAEYSRSTFNMGQIAQGTFVYKIPFGKGQQWSTGNGILDDIFGNWQTSGGYRWDSGQPVVLGGGPQKTVPGYGARVNLNAPLKKNAGTQGLFYNGVMHGDYFADPSAVGKPADYADGTAPRALSSINSPGTSNFNLAVDKDFPVKGREGMVFKFRWETYNLFNHVQFGGLNAGAVFDSSGAVEGKTQGQYFGALTSQANSPLIQQVSLRLDF
ncbi:MAG: carboxypeptidase regulatory-like domain-containing protein [Terracidiphilus sp.]